MFWLNIMPPKKKKKKEIKIEVDNMHTYHIHGIKVLFPVKAYPSQISIMNKILHGIDQKRNCLLESPTGSGKSLALLCSCLAWQANEKERINDNGNEYNLEEVDPGAATTEESCQNYPKELTTYDDNTKVERFSKQETDLDKNKKETSNGDISCNEVVYKNEDEEDFMPALKRTRRSVSKGKLKTPNRKESKRVTEDSTSEISNDQPEKPSWTMETMKTSHDIDVKMKDKKVKVDEKLPKIYFGTRTHKQIAQIIRELRKTIYKDVKMSILGSREYLCIHPSVSKSKEKNEECKSLLKGFEGKSCRYHSNVHLFRGKHPKQKFNADSAWDIEDLITAGKKMKACPYYGTRDLTKGAEIIFCPYNYLIDPMIRGQMLIDLKDQIVVLDEAHNIEDSAREAASVSLTMLQLQDTKTNLREMIDLRVMVDSHQKMLVLCNGLLNWVESVEGRLEKRGFENDAKVWTGKEMVKMLADEPSLRLTTFSLTLYKDELQKLIAEEQDSFTSFDDKGPRLNTKSLACMSSIIFTLEKLLDQQNDFASDYRVALLRTSTLRPASIQMPGGWLKKSNKMEKVWTYKLNLWCLNPAVVFSEIGNLARTIVVTSGTLSPMTSFSSELGVSFPISLEANHVVDDSQVWIGNVGIGPSNVVINANYKNSETFLFQDEVGKTVLQICKVIPKGVLCFLPSYNMMEKLAKRWKATGLWDELSKCKVIQMEPRATDRSDFDETLQCFYDCVNSACKSEETLNGAILFAVCRGKVSEGMDFSDDNARGVIVIGIPFPNIKDVQVELKRKYNSSNVSRGLLNGNDWYEMQAFRALNQAVGRCIRHRNDWGAILMIDERFGKSPKYRDGLSKWVRNRLQHYSDFQVCLTSLNEFVESRLNPQPENISIASVAIQNQSLNSVNVTTTVATPKMDTQGHPKSLLSSIKHPDNRDIKVSGDVPMARCARNKSISTNNDVVVANSSQKTPVMSRNTRNYSNCEPCKRKQSTSPVGGNSLLSPKRFQWRKSPLNRLNVVEANPYPKKQEVLSRKSLPLSFVNIREERCTHSKSFDENIQNRDNVNTSISFPSKGINAPNVSEQGIQSDVKTKQKPNQKEKGLIIAVNTSTSKRDARLNDSLNDVLFDDLDFEELKSSFSSALPSKKKTQIKVSPIPKSSNTVSEEAPVTNKRPLPYNSKCLEHNQVVDITSTNPSSKKTSCHAKSTAMSVRCTTIESQFEIPFDRDGLHDSQLLDDTIDVRSNTTILSPVSMDIGDTQFLNGVVEAENAKQTSVNRTNSAAMEIDVAMAMDDTDLSMISTQMLTTGKEKVNMMCKAKALQKNTDNNKTRTMVKPHSFVYPTSKSTSTPNFKHGECSVDSNIVNSVSKKFNQSKCGSLNQSKTEFVNQSKIRPSSESRSVTKKTNIRITTKRPDIIEKATSKPTERPCSPIRSPSLCTKSKITITTPPSPDLFEFSVFNFDDDFSTDKASKSARKSPSIVCKNNVKERCALSRKSLENCLQQSKINESESNLKNTSSHHGWNKSTEITEPTCSNKPAPKNKKISRPTSVRPKNDGLEQKEPRFVETAENVVTTTILTEDTELKTTDHKLATGCKKQLGTRRKRRLGTSNKIRNLRGSSVKPNLDETDKSFVDLCSSDNIASNENNVQERLCCHQCTNIVFTGVLHSESLTLPAFKEPVQVYQMDQERNDDLVTYTTNNRSACKEARRLHMNAYYEEESNQIYQSLYCKHCERLNHESNAPIGFSVLTFNASKEKLTYLFQDGTKVT